MIIKAICGVGCVGKTTYANKLLSEYKNKNLPRPVVLRVGKFLRETLGSDFFTKLTVPGAPEETANWVKSLVYNAILMGYQYSRDVILDGFPRTKEQFEWLMYSSIVSTKTIEVEIDFLWTADGIIEERIAKRTKENPDEKDLIIARIHSDAAMLSTLWSTAKDIVDNESFKNLKINEINV